MTTTFATDALRIARLSTTRVFGTKAFVASIWAQLRSERAYKGLTLAGCKARLLAAHLAGDLQLARIDLVAAVGDDYLVRTSEISDGNSTYHTIRI